jgi:hypothetical protein
MLFHQPTVEKTKRMQFESGILKAVSERPDIIAGLQSRMEDNARLSLTALQVGCSAKILGREGGVGFPNFRANGSDLPGDVRDSFAAVADIFNSARRLGAWFAQEKLVALQRILAVEL